MRKAWNKLSYKEMERQVSEIGGTLISKEYINARTKLKFKCTKCSEIYETTLYNFKSRKQITCRKCSMKKVFKDQSKTHEQFTKELNEKYNSEYEVLNSYISSNDKVTVRHLMCGFEYEVLPLNILKGRQCPKCQKRVKNKDTEYYKNEIKEIVGDEYSLLSEYKSSRFKVEFRHNKCGFEYFSLPNDFQQGKRCPRCRESKGEKAVSNVLERRDIKYVPQFFFEDLRGFGGRPLRFDFAVFNRSNKLKALIEYDGEFHFNSKEHFGGETALGEQQLRDELKNQYCKKHKIELIRIPYWQFDEIETILENAI